VVEFAYSIDTRSGVTANSGPPGEIFGPGPVPISSANHIYIYNFPCVPERDALLLLGVFVDAPCVGYGVESWERSPQQSDERGGRPGADLAARWGACNGEHDTTSLYGGLEHSPSGVQG
jgi:hypothetical protein